MDIFASRGKPKSAARYLPWGLTAAILLPLPPCHGQPSSLRVCDDVAAPISLDPLKEFSEKYYTIIQQIFDSLVRFSPEGKVEPSLAVAWRWVDDLTVEFELRKDVQFHNGEPFNADSVKFSIEKLIDPRSGFPGAGFLHSIAGVEVVDPHAVRIKTKYPDGILIHRLAGLVPIMPPKYIAEHGQEHFGAHPVGTGAFRFLEWDRRDPQIVLGANEGYWVAGFPKWKRLVFKFIPQQMQVEKLLSGDVDVVTELPGTDTLRVMKSGMATVVKKASFYTPASSLNTRTGPLADKRVRQALNYALNKEHLVRYDLLGNGTPLATLTLPGESGHNPDLRPYPYDIKKAKRLLKEAGHSGGFHLKALVKVQGLRTMRIIADHMSKVGITVDITTTTDTEAVRDMSKRPWDWVFAGCPDPISHSFFIQFIFLSSLSPFSVTGDAAYDARLAKMAGTIDPRRQLELGLELDRYVHDQALSLFTYQRIKTHGVRNGVRFIPSVTGMPYFYLTAPEDHARAPSSSLPSKQ